MKYIGYMGKYILAALLSICVTSASHAMVYGFDCITNNSAQDCAIGEDQLSVDVTEELNGQVTFTFYNNGSEDSSIEGIYFDDGSILGIAYLTDKDEGIGGLDGVDFTAGSASPGNLPGANQADPDFETTAGFLADSDPPVSKRGINPGEWLGITFDLINNKDINDVYNELANGDLRIGMHVIAFDSGGSESFVHTPPSAVPVPASVWLFGSSLLALVGFKRK